MDGSGRDVVAAAFRIAFFTHNLNTVATELSREMAMLTAVMAPCGNTSLCVMRGAIESQ